MKILKSLKKRTVIILAVAAIVLLATTSFVLATMGNKDQDTVEQITQEEDLDVTTEEPEEETDSSQELEDTVNSDEKVEPVPAPLAQEQPPESARETPSEEKFENPYDFGWAMWHVYNRRMEMGKSMSDDWPPTQDWQHRAVEDGYKIQDDPKKHAIVITPTRSGMNMAHMEFVEKMHGDGSITVSCMNCHDGFGQVSEYKISADQLGAYKFIY